MKKQELQDEITRILDYVVKDAASYQQQIPVEDQEPIPPEKEDEIPMNIVRKRFFEDSSCDALDKVINHLVSGNKP